MIIDKIYSKIQQIFSKMDFSWVMKAKVEPGRKSHDHVEITVIGSRFSELQSETLQILERYTVYTGRNSESKVINQAV